MPKKKEGIDEWDLEILTALYYLQKATAFDLSNITGIARGTVAMRLRELEKMGVVKPPKIDISTGKLKKIYTAPDRKLIEKLRFDAWKEEVKEVLSEDEGELEKVFEEEVLGRLEWEFSTDDIKKLTDGVPFTELVNKDEGISPLVIFDHETVGNLEVSNGIVKITKTGLRRLVEMLKENIRGEFAKLVDLSRDEAGKLLNELIKVLEKD